MDEHAAITRAPRPRVGWLTLERPDAQGGGGARRQYHLLSALRRNMDVEVFTADASGELGMSPVRKLLHAARTHETAPDFRSTGYAERVARELTERGIETVVIAHIETAAALRPLMRSQQVETIVDLHNIYSLFYRQQGSRRLANSWSRLESHVWSLASALCVLSSEDAAIVRPHNPLISLVPNGVDPNEWRVERSKSPSGLAYFGAWTHAPNQIGLDWFLAQVWPSVRARRPDATLHLYGPGKPEVRQTAGVVIHGRAERLDEALGQHAGIIVPIVAGVGTRVKFIEALASGVPVVSTSLGAQGYSVPAEHFLLADTSDNFAVHCLQVLAGDIAAETSAVAARAFVDANYTWDVVAKGMGELILQVSGRANL